MDVASDIKTETVTLNMGPQHPSTHGVLRVILEMEGEVIRLPRCYPVYFRGYSEVMQPVEEYLNSVDGLHVIGRYGAYKYNNQDHSILMGMRVSENILDGAGFNLWAINTDYEVYQESSVITKTGLVTQGS